MKKTLFGAVAVTVAVAGAVARGDGGAWDMSASLGLNSSLSLRATVGNVHDSDPAPGKEKGDTTVRAALVYKFSGKP